MLRAMIFLVAILAGGGAAWMSLVATAPLPSEAVAVDLTSETTEILVATIDLERGALVDPAAMRWQNWPQEALHPTFITRDLRPDAVLALDGMVVRGGVIAGEPIYEAKLAAGDVGILSVMLSPGRRAIAVRISAENTAGGFVLPNDRVDVLLTTTRQDSSGKNQASSRVILKNVKVLAVDQVIDGSSDTIVGKTATLELKPEEVETLTAAEVSGAVSLALRALADNAETSVIEEIVTKKTLRIFRNGQIEVVELER